MMRHNDVRVQRVYQDETGKLMVEMGFYYSGGFGTGFPKERLTKVEQWELKDLLSKLFEDSNANSSAWKSVKQTIANLLRRR